MTRVTAAVVARAVARMAERLAAAPERFAALGPLVDALPDGYDPDQTPEARADA